MGEKKNRGEGEKASAAAGWGPSCAARVRGADRADAVLSDWRERLGQDRATRDNGPRAWSRPGRARKRAEEG